MGSVGALALLAFTLLVGVVGLAIYTRGAAIRDQALVRSRPDTHEASRRQLHGRVEARARATRQGAELERGLTAAGLQLGVIEALVAVLVVVALAYVGASLLLPTWLAVAVALGALWGCRRYLAHKRRQRTERFVAQLPELARVLSNASSAGLSLRSALDMASGELDDPASSELVTIVGELNIGQRVDQALTSLERRMPSREVGVLVSTLVIQQRTGGDIVHGLRNMADTLEARKDLRREVRTVMAGSVFTSYLVAFLGVGTLVLLNQINPGVVEDMLASFFGRIALIVGVALYVVGFTLIRRTVRIET